MALWDYSCRGTCILNLIMGLFQVAVTPMWNKNADICNIFQLQKESRYSFCKNPQIWLWNFTITTENMLNHSIVRPINPSQSPLPRLGSKYHILFCTKSWSPSLVLTEINVSLLQEELVKKQTPEQDSTSVLFPGSNNESFWIRI